MAREDRQLTRKQDKRHSILSKLLLRLRKHKKEGKVKSKRKREHVSELIEQKGSELVSQRSKMIKKKKSISKKLKLNLKIDIPSNYSEIIPGLYLGEVISAVNKEDLLKHNITAIVNCTTSFKSSFEEIDYFNIKVLDSGDAESVSLMTAALQPAANFIHEKLSQGDKVLVHCHRGLSRSPTIIAAYLILFQKLSVDQAISVIKNKRFVKPRLEFKQALMKLEKDLKILS